MLDGIRFPARVTPRSTWNRSIKGSAVQGKFRALFSFLSPWLQNNAEEGEGKEKSGKRIPTLFCDIFAFSKPGGEWGSIMFAKLKPGI